MNGLMDLPRFRLVHGKNVDQIFDRRVAQSLKIREAGFNERERLLLRNRQPGAGFARPGRPSAHLMRRRRVAID